ncbi:FT-interacting protein 1-like [Chenopodium quinoa]|uniref:C2 domain-containing protein n=1 Tax=Chenopodium quinoa TaxID=63459 RepID=A0A803NBG5_CHEQI|nr:FT-interacting protein 1-like [Chenopodium quinoa]
MNNIKLGVEVTAAHDLVPKDGEGSSSAYVELKFDDQRYRTSTKEKDLNPVWNEVFYFNISNPNNLPNLTLEAVVYSYNQSTNAKDFLGKVCISGSSFVTYPEASEFYFPLEKRHIFSRVKGELGLKVYYTNDPSNRLSMPPPAMESDHLQFSEGQEAGNEIPKSSSRESKSNSRHTFWHLPKQQDSAPKSQPQPQVTQHVSAAKSESQAPKVMQANPGIPGQAFDYKLRETSPMLGGGRVVGGRVIRSNYKPVSTYDLVEQMLFLFVRVVKARELPTKDLTGSLDPYVEVKVGNYKGVTKYFEKKKDPEWNEVFAFSRERLQASVLEVQVKDKDLMKDDFVGVIRFDLHEVPTRVPPDSPLAPQWYRLEDKKGDRSNNNGELMLAVWYGTQADEAFTDAWHSDAITPPDMSASAANHIRSKVYHSPRLWYLRVNVIEAQDLITSDKGRFPDCYIKAQLGAQTLSTKPVQSRMGNPFWNEDLMFVAAEPFDEHLIITVEDRKGQGKEETLGKVSIPLAAVRKRPDDKNFPTQWINLQKPSSSDTEEEKKVKFASKLHARISLDGGYHVLNESTYYSSDLRPSMKQLWKSSIGVLELGILNADGLHPMKTRDGRGTADTFCVAKYCQKWVRTRTIIDSLSPKYNEQYTWEVYDPATVLTIGVFDNGHIDGNKDTKIGKVRIRISTLEAGRVYTHSYPLLVLQPSGLKKMGELHLAIRFSCTNMTNMMFLYGKPLLPKMHYSRPLSLMQTNTLRVHATNVLASRLSRAEPPLKKEVVEYMCDVDAHFWSMRRSKANFYRIISLLQSLIAIGKWFTDVCAWKNPVTTVLVHLLFVMLVCFPDLILPTVFLYMFLIGLWNYRYRPKNPPHMDTRISYADNTIPDELDEEFDTFPTTKGTDVVRRRYDRLRSIGAKVQSVLGDFAAQGERAQALLSWRDPRASVLFLTFCLFAAFVLYAIPFNVMALLAGFYTMRHPRFRSKYPSSPTNFFRRLPAKTDCLL